jgi:hypothetical protein
MSSMAARMRSASSCYAYVAQHGAGELREEALDEVQPRAMLRSKGKFEAALRLCREPGFGFLGRMGEKV